MLAPFRPVTSSVALLTMMMLEQFATEPEPTNATVPLLIVAAPVNELEPPSVNVLPPIFTTIIFDFTI